VFAEFAVRVSIIYALYVTNQNCEQAYRFVEYQAKLPRNPQLTVQIIAIRFVLVSWQSNNDRLVGLFGTDCVYTKGYRSTKAESSNMETLGPFQAQLRSRRKASGSVDN
jgi:hypothetical protein